VFNKSPDGRFHKLYHPSRSTIAEHISYEQTCTKKQKKKGYVDAIVNFQSVQRDGTGGKAMAN